MLFVSKKISLRNQSINKNKGNTFVSADVLIRDKKKLSMVTHGC